MCRKVIDSVSISCLIFLFTVCSGYEKCPKILDELPNKCDGVICEKVIIEDSCPSGTIYEHNFSLCKCCPSCVKYIGLDEKDKSCVERDDYNNIEWELDPNCDPEDNHCPIQTNTCLPGLECKLEKIPEPTDPTTLEPTTDPSTVEPTTEKPFFTCHLPEPHPESRVSCMYRKSLFWLGLSHWYPKCEPDGTYSPKQCKGSYRQEELNDYILSHFSGECFCMNRNGERIFGREFWIQAENQTCACSRKVSELRSQGLITTLHCSTDGNFEPLQCDTDSGLCYCVEPKTGEILGPVVPEVQWKLLPCYSLNITNGSTDGRYLRKCESEYAAIRALEIEHKFHGTNVVMRKLNCDYDGSFAPKHQSGTTFECVFKNGTKILNFQRSYRDESMTCNCARDKYEYFPLNFKPLPWDCQLETGNYDFVYDFGSYVSAVDADGYLFGDVAKSKFYCCLLDGSCSPEMIPFCYDNETLIGYRRWDWWPYRNS